MAIDVLADASPSSRVRDRRATWLFCIIAALAVLICAFRGLGMDVDSTAYLASGANLAHGHGLTGIGGTPFTLFGPALPSFVAVGVLVGLSAQTAALIVNVLSAVLTVIVGRILLKRHVSDPRLIVAGSVFIAIGWPLIQVTSLAIPEPITVVVLLLLVLVLEEFNQTRRPVVSLAAMVGLLNLAFFLRYANLAFIPVAVLVVFFARRNTDDLLRRSSSAAVVLVLSLLGPCLWMLRNHGVDGSLLGPRYKPIFGVATVGHQYVLAIAKLFLPGPNLFEDLVFVVVVVATGTALRLVYLAGPGGASAFIRRLAPWAVLLLVCVFYAVYLYAAELATKIDPVDSRLLVPIYIPCVILLIGLAEAVLSHSSLSDKSKLLMRRALLLFVCVQVVISFALIGDFALKGRDFTSTAWRTSTLVTAAKPSNDETSLYTNNPQGLWARLGDDRIYLLPTTVAKARKDLSCPGVRVVFFSQGGGTYYGDSSNVTEDSSPISLKTLKSNLTVKPLFSSAEGELFRVASDAAGRSHCK
jgi:hypothetical protein